jgi:hypothetical protein
MGARAGALLRWKPPSTAAKRAGAAAVHASAVILSDVPAPNNPCPGRPGSAAVGGAAAEGEGSDAGVRRAALAALVAKGGLRMYDADHPGLDAGVLAIREWLLARDARHYVTCHAAAAAAAAGGARGTPGWLDAECRACARVSSPYVAAVLAVRAAQGRRSVTSWFTGEAHA